ncbi:hypothetical protein JTB14_022470 [Gonioctena quinquepunctata]|nr:hypothetical protein JTB14_022470 [Gonioctena quinquepunctata]
MEEFSDRKRPWRRQREFLTNGELLEAAEQAAIEFEEIPLDNSILTDEEKSGEEISLNNAINETVNQSKTKWKNVRILMK